MNLISTEEAAAIKSKSRFVIILAIKRGVVDVIQVGGRYVVKASTSSLFDRSYIGSP